MAWTARLDSITPSQGKILINASYFDAADVGFVTQLGSQSFTFEASISLANAQAQIVAAAKEYRTAYNKTATFVGVTVNVP